MSAVVKSVGSIKCGLFLSKQEGHCSTCLGDLMKGF